MLLVFANKQDLPNAMNAAEITDKLGLHSLRQRHWYVAQPRGFNYVAFTSARALGLLATAIADVSQRQPCAMAAAACFLLRAGAKSDLCVHICLPGPADVCSGSSLLCSRGVMMTAESVTRFQR